jgi:hypothetical protein
LPWRQFRQYENQTQDKTRPGKDDKTTRNSRCIGFVVVAFFSRYVDERHRCNYLTSNISGVAVGFQPTPRFLHGSICRDSDTGAECFVSGGVNVASQADILKLTIGPQPSRILWERVASN